MPFQYSEEWKTNPSQPRLADDEVQVWAVELDVSAGETRQLACILSTDERERASRFLVPDAARRFTVARAVLRMLLGRYLGLGGSGLSIAYGVNGKPYLDLRTGAPQFNLAHSDDLAVIAVSAYRSVGVDLEKRRWDPGLEPIAERYFAAGESAAVGSAPAEKKADIFFSIWTMKEAILKATGVGLAGELQSIEMSPGRRMVVQQLGRTWHVQDLPGISGFACALAVENGAAALSCYRWNHSHRG